MAHQIAANSSSEMFHLRSLSRVVPAEVAEGPNGTVELLMFYHNTEFICAYTSNEPDFSWSRNSGFELREGTNVGTRQLSNFSQISNLTPFR